jgi:uncharacterized protein YcfL
MSYNGVLKIGIKEYDMKTFLAVCLLTVLLVFCGCQSKDKESNVHFKPGVGSDNIVSNFITRPIGNFFSALIGEGIEEGETIMGRNESGFLVINVKGYNRSPGTKRFKYKVEWLDANGARISNRTSVWLPMSVTGKNTFSIKAVAPTKEAVNFTLDTKRWE